MGVMHGRGACVVGGMHGGGCGKGACMAGVCVAGGGDTVMGGWYATYWNAFLFSKIFTENCVK